MRNFGIAVNHLILLMASLYIAIKGDTYGHIFIVVLLNIGIVFATLLLLNRENQQKGNTPS